MNYKILLIFTCLVSSLHAFDPTLPPEAALKKLKEGNERFAQDKSTCPKRTEERRLALVSKQNPFAIIVGCSDSRVSPDLVFDQGVGDLFVVRVAGNVIGAIESDSIEYGVKVLHASLILVLGHANCGAVSAVLSGQTQGIAALAKKIEPSIKAIKPDEPRALERAIKANIRGSVKSIQDSPELKSLFADKQIRVLGGYYDLETGRVEIID